MRIVWSTEECVHGVLIMVVRHISLKVVGSPFGGKHKLEA